MISVQLSITFDIGCSGLSRPESEEVYTRGEGLEHAGTYELSKLEYVLTKFLIALEGAIDCEKMFLGMEERCSRGIKQR